MAAVLVATTAACGGGYSDPQIPSDAQELGLSPVGASQSYSSSGFPRGTRLVVRDQQGWQSAWGTLTQHYSPPPSAPAIDFASEMVLVAAMGQRNTGGYLIEIKEAAANADALFVSVMETSPGQGCIVTQALTAPVAVARVARHEGEVRFLESQTVTSCR